MDEQDVEKLIDKFDQSNLTELRIDGQLYFSKLDHPAQVTAQPAAPAASPAAPQTKAATANNAGAKIKAPLVGIVYFAPSPDKPVFKAVGDHVKKGETVCVIEAMKVINDVKSPVSGTITKQLVSDGDMVEYDQPIFAIEED
ncbi:acetyl-CoA carboxylase biotin carboxyl carrier protein subunit [Nicoliella spurrieriana]|uniref:Biotin carboxyl carrier protein of acetyl-CoA carboxylase n=1 Tax=Nicoliella spurrieriana TaxID=2925830 RepID=A0A976RTA8_9LACO|nr:acetyl-CoA carboxylase biotin carboxyl carrier protein subunit [Nicoliella spurrieriana]UQS87428.1 acetyl-CoA carboxylase biotin carboxyl carrier protein subunit [Nicoliella spurrieriana]